MFPTTVNQFRALYEGLDDARCAARPWVEGLWRTVLDVSDGFEAVAMVMLPNACIFDVAPGRAGCYSDAHKDAYGWRPRSWAPTCAEYGAEMARLDAMVIAELEAQAEAEDEWRREQAEEAEEARFEASVWPYAAMLEHLDWDLPDRLAAA
jgi:hypothetical protein